MTLPAEPPAPVAERVQALRDWWQLYDARQAAQRAGMEPLDGFVPTPWDYRLPEEQAGRPPGRERHGLEPERLSRIEALWGWQVLDRQPDVLVRELWPLGVVAELVQPAARFWDDLSLAAWYLCFGPYSRRTLDELDEHQEELRAELAELGAPVDTGIYAELLEVASEHRFLVEPPSYSFGISFEIGPDDDGNLTVESRVDEPGSGAPAHPEVFDALRDIITRHRRDWLERHLGEYLDRLWRRDLEVAAVAYWKRYRGRGKAPTVKQALPDLKRAARRWFGGDHGELARLLGLDGPITESPARSTRPLPNDMAALQHEVAERLGAAAPASDDLLRRRYDVGRLAQQSVRVLVAWQATGYAPPRSAVFGSEFRWVIEETLGCDLDEGYRLLLKATRDALERRDHPAAASMALD